MRIVYKQLRENGTAPHTGWRWPLPTDDGPGDWVELDGPPVLCQRGFHGWHHNRAEERLAFQWSDDMRWYEMEVAGTVVEDELKLAASRARLLRKVVVACTSPLQRVAQGERDCIECGERHWSFRLPGSNLAPQWGHPVDGHLYRQESEATVERRVQGQGPTTCTCAEGGSYFDVTTAVKNCAVHGSAEVTA
jgi:hypothetical protein